MTIIPYLIAVLVAIAVFGLQSDGFLIDGIRMGVSGSRAGHAVRGRSAYHADETAQRQRGAKYDAGCDEHLQRGFVHQPPLFHRAGSSDTTFYVVALYFGSVGIRNTYYTIPCSLLAG